MCTVELTENSTVISSKYKETLNNMVNRVRIYDGEGNPLGMVQNDADLKYGVFQQVYTKEEGKDANTTAKSMFSGVEKTFTLECINYNSAITGAGGKRWDELQEKYRNTLTNAVGQRIIKLRSSRVDLKGEPNSITQVQAEKGGITRNYYGENGKQVKQISNNNHGKPKQHPYGVHGEHAHDYTYDENGKLIRGKARELTLEERKENGDIL